MKNLFEQSRSHWVRYDRYELKTAADGKRYVTPAKDAKPDAYNPMKEMPGTVLDALNVGMLMMGRRTDVDVDAAILEFVTKYGLLGLMTALATTPSFMDYEAVYLPKNHFIKAETMETEDYLALFYPFEQLDVVKQGVESRWTVSGDRTMIALTMTFADEPMAKTMSFQREYAEPYDWIAQQLKDWAFTLTTSVLYYHDYDSIDEGTRNLYRKAMAAFGGIAPSYHIELLEKPTIYWDFHSLLLGIQMMFSFMLVDDAKPLRLCKHCQKVFISSRANAAFCSARCKNQYNVYKSRENIKNRTVTKMPESQNTEWKSKWKDEYLEWICGYANAQGGKIYIGCDDEGNVVGLPNARKLLEDIPNKIRDAMGIIVGVNLLDKDGKEYIEIDVPPYPIGISCKGVYYYRSGSTRADFDRPALEAFLMRKRGATWDNLPLPAFSMNDVDDEVVAHFKQWAAKKGRIGQSVLDEPKDALMEKLHLMNGPYLTNAAMLLFSKDPEKWQLGAYVKIGYFETDADLLYQDEIHGSILEQIDKIVELVYLKYMKAKITYEGMQRIERYFVPEEALREALLNALCHKQYQSGVPIQISVYEDKLYIANCGCLPENWTLENLMSKHASSPYNPNIAHVFYLAGFIESWGRGIEKICSACEKDGVPQPEYTINPGDIMIKFTAPEDRVIRSVTGRVTEKVTDKVTDTLDETSLKILNLLAVDPAYTTTFLSENLSLSRKTVSLRLKMLKENGLIERVGSDRKGYWKLLK